MPNAEYICSIATKFESIACCSSSLPKDTGMAQSTNTGYVMTSIIALLILASLVFGIVLWVMVRKRKKRLEPISNVQLTNTLVIESSGSSARNCDITLAPNSNSPSCFVVYSHNTPPEEKEVILQNLIKGLSVYGIETTSHDWVGRAMLPFWVETILTNASVVLCVCNRAFHQEWLYSEASDRAVVHSVKHLLGADLCQSKEVAKKYAVVLMKRSHQQFIPSYYLKGCRQFYVTDVSDIAHFIKNVPVYSVDL